MHALLGVQQTSRLIQRACITFCTLVRKQAQCHSPHDGLLLQSLQSSMADGGSALASMQRLVEERTQQASTAQQALIQLQQEHAHLTAHMRTLQDQAASRSVPPPSCLLCFA